MPETLNKYDRSSNKARRGNTAPRNNSGTSGGRASAGSYSTHQQSRRTEPSYSSGNSNWNTDSYNRSVRTERTNTRVINTGSKSSYYYDNTPAALKERHRREFDRRRAKWKSTLQKSRRLRRLKRALISFVTITVAVIAVLSFVYKLFFVTKNITVEGAVNYSAEEIITACGLSEKSNLYSFSSREAGEKISFYCPLVAQTSFDRTVPDKLSITVTEEEPVFCVNIYGDYYSLSDSLRVLEKLDSADAKEAGLIDLKIRSVSFAVSGSQIQLASQRAQRYLENAVTLLNQSELKDKITAIDLTDDFDIVMVAENMYRLDFGTQDDLDVKIRLAVAILKDELFQSGNRAYIDLKDTSKTSVVIDNQLTFD